MACFKTSRFYFSVVEWEKVVQKVLIKSIIGAVEPKELFLEKREKGKGRMREQKEKRERRET